ALENSAWIHRWPKPCCANSWMMKSCCASLKVKRSITSPVLSIAITKKPDAVAEKRANDLQTKDQTFFLKVTNINTVAAVAQGTLDQKTLVESALLYLCQIQHFFLFQSAVFILHHRSEEHTSELQSRENLVCRLLLQTKKENSFIRYATNHAITVVYL